MATKEQGVACYDRAAPNEPIFVLRAQDLFAPAVVRYWAYLASGGPPIDHIPLLRASEKTADALQCAVDMEAWPTRKVPD